MENVNAIAQEEANFFLTRAEFFYDVPERGLSIALEKLS